MEVAVKQPPEMKTGTESERLTEFGRSLVGSQFGVRIGERTKEALTHDAWDQFIESAASFCGEVSTLDRDNPVLDEQTIEAWYERAEKLYAATSALRTIARGDEPHPGSGPAH